MERIGKAWVVGLLLFAPLAAGAALPSLQPAPSEPNASADEGACPPTVVLLAQGAVALAAARTGAALLDAARGADAGAADLAEEVASAQRAVQRAREAVEVVAADPTGEVDRRLLAAQGALGEAQAELQAGAEGAAARAQARLAEAATEVEAAQARLSAIAADPQVFVDSRLLAAQGALARAQTAIEATASDAQGAAAGAAERAQAAAADAAVRAADAAARAQAVAAAAPDEAARLVAEAQGDVDEAAAAVQAIAADPPGTVNGAAEQALAALGAARARLDEAAGALGAAADDARASVLAAPTDAGDAATDAATVLADPETTVRTSARGALLQSPVVPWTNVNMGPGSCLDADTLDGLQAADFIALIEAEAAARRAADEALQAAIDAEAATRAAADAGLQQAIDDERAARIAADDALQALISSALAGDATLIDRVNSLSNRVTSLEGYVRNGAYVGSSLSVSGTVSAGALSVGTFSANRISAPQVQVLAQGLPSCNSSLRGVMMVQPGTVGYWWGGGSPDTLYICLMSSTGGFSWRGIASG